MRGRSIEQRRTVGGRHSEQRVNLLITQPLEDVIGNAESHDALLFAQASDSLDAGQGWVDDRSMARMVDVYVWKRHDRRQAEKRLDVIYKILANGLVGRLIIHADLECPADDDMISAWKHVSVLTIQVL
jgi:hypothetical protein